MNGALNLYRRELWTHVSDSLRIICPSPQDICEATGMTPIQVDVFFAKASTYELTLDEIVEFADLMGIRLNLRAKI
jgi:hypothetical protein